MRKLFRSQPILGNEYMNHAQTCCYQSTPTGQLEPEYPCRTQMFDVHTSNMVVATDNAQQSLVIGFHAMLLLYTLHETLIRYVFFA